VNDIENEIQFVRKIYRDILNGYTYFNFKNKKIYFKHLKEIDFSKCNQIYIEHFKKSEAEGLLPIKNKLKILEENGDWSQLKDEKIKSLSDEINNLNQTKSKLIIKSQIEEFNKKIQILSKELKEIESEKKSLLGLTAEGFAERKSNEYILYLSLYSNEQLSEKVFKNEEDFEETDANDLADYFFIYRDLILELSERNLRKIAVSPFFLNYYFLCSSNPFFYYGKSIIELTRYQLDLFTLGKHYENILTKTGKNPPEYIKTLDELVDWYDNKGFFKNAQEKDKDQIGKTYIGATKEELKELISDSKDEVVDLVEEAKKFKGDLSFEDILKIHGEK
jgi:hypothetical protein